MPLTRRGQADFQSAIQPIDNRRYNTCPQLTERMGSLLSPPTPPHVEEREKMGNRVRVSAFAGPSYEPWKKDWGGCQKG
jgi:hypothetical protein